MNVYRPSIWQLICTALVSLACTLASPMRTPVLATDLGVAPIYRPPTPVVDWTGSYLQVSGGSAWGNFTGGQTPTFDLNGGIVGVTSGFNIQKGNLVYGYAGDTAIASRQGTAFPSNAAFSNEVKEPWLSTFRGRLGYAQGNWMVYATAGGALGAMDKSILGPGQISDQHWHLGWTVGGGVEMQLTQDWSAKVEYLYVGLQDKSYFNPTPSAAFLSNQRTSLDDHIVRLGVNYKLPWGILDSFFKH
jgi:outer membrane immunogenic protein